MLRSTLSCPVCCPVCLWHFVKTLVMILILSEPQSRAASRENNTHPRLTDIDFFRSACIHFSLLCTVSCRDGCVLSVCVCVCVCVCVYKKPVWLVSLGIPLLTFCQYSDNCRSVWKQANENKQPPITGNDIIYGHLHCDWVSGRQCRGIATRWHSHAHTELPMLITASISIPGAEPIK